MNLSRRQFIRNVSVTGGALTLGFTLGGCSETPLAPVAENVFRPNAFLSIDATGQVLVQIHRAEMGQGTITGIVTLIAEELEVDPALVNYSPAPVHPAYSNSEYVLQITGGSTSMRLDYETLRSAGASAREVLLAAASSISGLAVADLQAQDGVIVSNDGGVSIAYGDLVMSARNIAVPSEVTLKSSSRFKLIGSNNKRPDAAEKSDGSARYSIDVQPENCAVAMVVRSPFHGGELIDFNADKARSYPGVIDVFAIDQGVAVVAEGYWPASKGVELVEAEFSSGDRPLHSSTLIRQAMEQSFDDGDFADIRSVKGSGMPAGAETVQADYYLPFLAHATMEPQNATAYVTDTHCELWVGSQSPDIARDTAAKILGRPRESVTVYNHLLGGGFGRRAAADSAAEAVAIAAKLDRPVKVVWSREDDTRQDFYRPAMGGRIKATVTADGAVGDWQHLLVGPSVNQDVFPQFGSAMLPGWIPQSLPGLAGDLMASTDFASVEGAKQLPYQFNGIDVQYMNLPTVLPLGYWRSVGHSHTAFVVESFIDELAHAAGQDPVVFRRQHLTEDSRERVVLDMVAEMSRWGEPREGRYQGVAVHESFHSVVAEVVEISMAGGRPKLEHVYCAVDCGLAINPEIVKDQMEGGIVFGLTAALYGEITVEEGAVQQSNFHDYPMLRHNEMPRVTVSILDSQNHPSGVGEPGVPPVAPALGNALFAATGNRHRELPLRFS